MSDYIWRLNMESYLSIRIRYQYTRELVGKPSADGNYIWLVVIWSVYVSARWKWHNIKLSHKSKPCKICNKKATMLFSRMVQETKASYQVLTRWPLGDLNEILDQ